MQLILEVADNANNVDPDQNKAIFHQGLHCLLRQKHSPGTEIYHFIEILTNRLTPKSTVP